MGVLHRLPARSDWDPLGTWAARLPSALASIVVMLMLSLTLLRWPQSASMERGSPASVVTALTASLAFALGPLAWLWGRTEVSDGLFSALLSLALLLAWRTYAAASGPWWPCWLLVALAMLTKGPVALLLVLLTLLPFAWLQGDGPRLRERLQPLRGMTLALGLAVPWYALALLREGEPFWRSFFGYHNVQRFTHVVNNHHRPWWFFLVLSLIASLPSTPLLVLGVVQQLRRGRAVVPADRSLGRFAFCWLMAVLLSFSCSATKLPSYWLPATPAAALLTALVLPAGAFSPSRHGAQQSTLDRSPVDRCGPAIALTAMAAILLLAAVGLGGARWWLPLIEDPSMPGLGTALEQAPWTLWGALIATAAALMAGGLLSRDPSLRLLQAQLVWLLMVPLVGLPLWRVGDQLRGAPIRTLASVAAAHQRPAEPWAMVGQMKPSLHYYGHRVVIYEGRSRAALINLAQRLAHERRSGLEPSSPSGQPTLLLVIDARTAAEAHWQGPAAVELGRAGTYRLLRLERRWLERRARLLEAGGERATWRRPRMERY
ncbi:MAG: ArnT family glycosyltransferase [Cyanobium sp.]